jgi:hypothetical protein
MSTIARTGWTSHDPSSGSDIAKISGGGSLIAESGVRAIPCASAFNFVKTKKRDRNAEEGYWQSAVIVDYYFEYQEKQGIGTLYVIDIGIIEVGMPWITHEKAGGNLVHDAQSIAVKAAAKAEALITNELGLKLKKGIKFPAKIRDQQCRSLFKSLFKDFMNDILSSKYYAGKRVDVATVSYDDASFALKDKSQYRSLKFYGRDC